MIDANAGCLVVGGIGDGGDAPEICRQVKALLETPPVEMMHDGEFTGRNNTRIHASNQAVLKYRPDRRFDTLRIASQWTMRRLQMERKTAVFHPRRTWLVWQDSNGGAMAGNISPRLQPAHRLNWRGMARPERILGRIAAMYYTFFHLTGERLDEGLSNFALDGANLYYIDDDLYPWDEHHSFASMVGRWLREFSASWLDESHASALGEHIGRALHPLPRIETDLFIQALRDVFLPEEATRLRTRLADACLETAAPAFRPLRVEGPVARDPDWSRPVGVFADVHANLPALEAVLATFRERGVDQFFCLGDIVGYGPHPEACIEVIRSLRIFSVRGNHDHFVAHGHGKVAMSTTARAVAEWTRERLSESDLHWLASLPLKRAAPDFGLLAVHGAPMDKSYFNGYVYESTWERNLDWMAQHDVRLALHGHSHMAQMARERKGARTFCPDASGNFNDIASGITLLGPGSVGQPRNGKPGAYAMILDIGGGRAEFFHVPYDPEPVIREMTAHDFPVALADRLRGGR